MKWKISLVARLYEKVELAFIDNLIWKTSTPRCELILIPKIFSFLPTPRVKMWNYSKENWIIPKSEEKGVERLLTSYIGEIFEIKQKIGELRAHSDWIKRMKFFPDFPHILGKYRELFHIQENLQRISKISFAITQHSSALQTHSEFITVEKEGFLRTKPNEHWLKV